MRKAVSQQIEQLFSQEELWPMQLAEVYFIGYALSVILDTVRTTLLGEKWIKKDCTVRICNMHCKYEIYAEI
jgi:hypothetical protein